MSSAPAILQPGRTCGALLHAHRVGVLFDADACYRAIRGAILRARRSVFILGWDIDSRVELVRGDDAHDDAPTSLAALLHATAAAHPELHAHVLLWDYSPIFLLERERWPKLRFARSTHERIRFAFDDRHPPGASQHEKIVVIDDRVAFCGGLDLCDVRWDRPGHRPDDSLRVDLRGRPYRPHHDMHMIVDGDAAAALGRLARERWHRATGERTDPVELTTADPWPPDAPIDLRETPVGLVRTRPTGDPADRNEHPPPVREVQQLWLDSIAAARRFIYIETPYLTLHAVTRALCHRLRDSEGPEVILVTSPTCNGWLENVTLGLLRDEIVAALRAADVHGRFAAWARIEPRPHGAPVPVNVHAKVCIVDDELLRIGSANLTCRSMSLDSECDLAIEAHDEGDRQAIKNVRERLIAEHTHAEPTDVARAVARTGSVLAAFEQLGALHGSVLPLPHRPPRVIPHADLVDPSRALTLAQLRRVLLHNDDRRSAVWKYVAIAWWTGAAVLLVLANALDWIDSAAVMSWLVEIGWTRPWAPLAVAAVFVMAGMMFVPVTLMITNCGLLFGPWLGGGYALLGAFTSAALYYWIGRWAGRDVVHRLAGPKLRNATRAVARRGLMAVVAVRVLPIAPHFVVGLAAGASRVGFRDYMLGTIIAMVPGAFVLVLLGAQIAAGFQTLSWTHVLLAGGAIVTALVVGWVLQRWVGQGAEVHRALEQEDGEPT